MASERERVVVWTPHGRDARLAIALLQRHGLDAVECCSSKEMVGAIRDAGCALVSQEALTPDNVGAIRNALGHQPAWCDFPFIVLAYKPEPGSAAQPCWHELGNVTVLHRPTQIETVLTAVGAALRARRRQYEAEQAIRHRDQFLAMLGHELRNPLAAIALATEAQNGNADGPPPSELSRRGREIVSRQARHLTRLLDGLLDVARVTTGKVVLDPVPLDLNAVLERCLQGARMSARQSAIEIVYAPAATPACVMGDAVRLEEVASNLLSNAIKYSPANSRIVVSTRIVGERCELTVQDQGMGISPEMLPRVFDLFAQADVSLDRSQGGLGIGLTLVKALVELHGGSVEARSAGANTGSTFSVSLPRAREHTEPSAPSSRHLPKAPLPRPLSVMVIDDNVDLLEMTKEVLIGFGCEVQTAQDGPSGLERLRSLMPALAFIDIGLPGLDGYELARRVRSERQAAPWLVALTGYGQPEDRERALAAGFDQHLTKPVSLAALRNVVEQASKVRARRTG
jgi:signal transduction histidine kinase/ActR/RegA family two-component response regulator